MTFRRPIAAVSATVVALLVSRPALAQPPGESVELVVKSGRSLRVALSGKVTVKAAGQPVTGTLVEPVYAYDRIVVPAGTTIRGHVARLENAARMTRIRAMAGGDFTSRRHVVLEFDTIVFDDGHEMPMQTVVGNGVEQLGLRVAGASDRNAVVARARQELAARTSGLVSMIRGPGKVERAKEALIDRLPYHPQYLRQGAVYTAELVSPLDFGTVTPIARADSGSAPAPQSILNARLVTGLDSADTPRGTRVHAEVTSPVFSEDHRLILPEGASLDGEVTFARRATHFHRNGQLRFLFESVKAPEGETHNIPASLYSVAAGETDHLAIDEEGGASVTNSKNRFVAPALAVLALRATVEHSHRFDSDDTGGVPGTTVQSGNYGSRALGGFFGLGLIGVGLSQISHPVGVALGVVGAVRTMYTNVLGKGQEVSFPADTAIQVQLAPGPSPSKSAK